MGTMETLTKEDKEKFSSFGVVRLESQESCGDNHKTLVLN